MRGIVCDLYKYAIGISSACLVLVSVLSVLPTSSFHIHSSATRAQLSSASHQKETKMQNDELAQNCRTHGHQGHNSNPASPALEPMSAAMGVDRRDRVRKRNFREETSWGGGSHASSTMKTLWREQGTAPHG